MSRVHRLALLSLVVSISISLSMPPAAAADEGAPVPAGAPAEEVLTPRELTERALNGPATVEFSGTPLRGVLKLIKSRHNIPIRINEQALTDWGIAVDTPINISVHDVSLRSVLRLMLEPCGLTFRVDEAGLEVIPTTEVKEKFPAEERIRRSLKSPTEVDFLDTPLRDALSYLKDYHAIQIWVNETALTEQGIAVDTPVTLSLRGERLESVLNVLLTPLHLDYLIEDEMLKITTHSNAQQIWHLQIYPVRELLAGGFSSDELKDVITSSVAPQSWDDHAGQASLRVVRENLLIVRQTPAAHRELASALEKLKAALRD
jgi:hypothetical protein